MSGILRVLIVDDEPGMCRGARRVLEAMQLSLPDIDEEIGFDVDVCETASAFFRRLDTSVPDILLLDCKLPDISGMEILERLSEQKRDMLSIMITAYATLETAVRATKLGAYDFLAKPFTPDELRYTIRKAARDVILTRKARLLAEERRRMRFQFISVLAHELKSPLNAVEGYLDIIKSRAAGDDQAAYDQAIERSLQRIGGMRKLILDLLDLTAIESGQRTRRSERLDIAHIARTIVNNNQAAAQETSISMNVSPEDPVLFSADRAEMEMLLNNLVSNAIKYNRPGGSVDVSIEPGERKVRISVRDTGIGMRPEDQAKLFKEFSRIKNEQTRGISGSGLGLSIVKKLALSYNGDVQVQSRPGQGTTFVVTLEELDPDTPA